MKGAKGVNFNDRELASKVRTLAMNETFHVLSHRKNKLYGPVLTRIAGTLLPRLNVLSGDENQPLVITISKTIADKNGVNISTG